jgi:adenylate cyclase
VDLDPNDGHIHFVLGIINMILGSEDEAQSALERAIELSPNSADAQHGLGWSRLYAGNAESALAPLLKAVELSPKDPRIFGYYLQLFLAHFLLGHHETALKHIKTAILHGQEDPWGQLYLAMVCHELGQIQESKAALVKAKTRLPVLSINWIKQMLGGMNHSYSTRLLGQCRRMGLPE